MTQFSDLKLDPKVLKAVVEAGYTAPTPIQELAIPPALEGQDVLGIAQTGTGKTAGFTLPMITLLGRGRARARMPRSLILCPTRELAAQVAENFETYAKYTRLTKALLIGGVSFGEQDKLIDRGVDVLIATPGRLLDHFERGKLLLTGVQIMVVDEADRMLDMGFIPDIERIFQLTPFTRQTLFFSATMAPEIERITDTFLHSPARVEIARQATASETIVQRLVEITPTRKDQTAKQKRELLRALINAEGEKLTNAIIFCNRKTDVDIVAKSLKVHGYDAAPIHGDLEQRVRTATLDGFRDGQLRFLVASDVAARGLDIPAVSHVFNFDLPNHAEDYVHRIGRTGRAGREGTAISLAVPADEKYLGAIEALLKQSLPRTEPPKGFSLSEGARSEPQSGDSGQRSSGSRSRGGRRSSSRRSEPRRDEAHQADPGRDASRKDEAGDSNMHSAQPETASKPEPQKAEAQPAAASKSGDHARSTSKDHDHREAHGDRRGGGSRDRGNGRGGDGRGNDRRGGDGRGGDGRGRAPVVGLGDNVPEFLTRSFRLEDLSADTAKDSRPAATETRSPAAESSAPKSPPSEAGTAAKSEAKPDTEAGTAATEEAPKVPARRRSRTRSKTASNAETSTETSAGDVAKPDAEATDSADADSAQPATEAATAPAADEPQAAEAASSPKPAPARKRSTRRKSPEATTDSAAESSAGKADDGAQDGAQTDEAAAKAEPAPSAPAAEGDTAEPAKPARAPRKRSTAASTTKTKATATKPKTTAKKTTDKKAAEKTAESAASGDTDVQAADVGAAGDDAEKKAAPVRRRRTRKETAEAAEAKDAGTSGAPEDAPAVS